MAQTSDEQGREINGKTGEPLRVESSIPQDKQENKGWYWCGEKKGFFRYSDWHKSLTELNLISS